MDEGEYFGLEDTPDIDDMIDTENARTEADSYHKFIGAEVMLPNRGDEKLMAKVKKKVKSDDRNDPKLYNPLRDISVYEVEFSDGTTYEVEANLIAECVVSECDPEGQQYRMLREIPDYRKDSTALNVADGSYRTRAGNPIPKRTTKGWKLLIEWVDGSMDWVRLAEIKDAYPVQVVEYALANGIAHEAAFNWWVYKVMKRKRNANKKDKE